MFNGFKTYLFSGLVIVFSLLFGFGLIEVDTFLTLIGIFGGGAIASERHAIRELEAK
jgi:hypothetical protein